jgi:hypothetical protein
MGSHLRVLGGSMAERTAFCSFCGGDKPCLCGACEFNAGPESCGGPDRCAAPPTRTDTPKPRVKMEPRGEQLFKNQPSVWECQFLIQNGAKRSTTFSKPAFKQCEERHSSTARRDDRSRSACTGFDTAYVTFHLICSCAFHPIEHHVTFKVGQHEFQC